MLPKQFEGFLLATTKSTASAMKRPSQGLDLFGRTMPLSPPILAKQYSGNTHQGLGFRLEGFRIRIYL